MMKKRTIILIGMFLAAACLTGTSFLAIQSPRALPDQSANDTSAPETEETSGAGEDANESVTAEPEPTTDSSGGEGLRFLPESEPEIQVPPELSGTQYGESEDTGFMPQPGEAVVYNYQELKSALEANNGITAVYFGADINMQIGGIRINPGKHHVIISGRNPFDPEQTDPYTLTDYRSSAFTNTIYIDAAGVNTLTVRDMNITGRNFYGPFSVLDASALSGTLLVYERVNYNGPQLGYHRKGAIHIEDCSVRIHGENGGSLNQEFSEAKHLLFKGQNRIETDSSANSVFWHPLGGSFTLADDSALTLISPDTSALYGIFFADLSAYKLIVTIGERAALDMTISGSVAPEAYVELSGFTVKEAGSFALKTTKAAAATVLRINGTLIVEKEANFKISGFGGASYSLLKQQGGDIRVMKDAFFHIISQNAHMELLNLSGCAFLCEDAASVLLYNAGRAISATGNPSRIYVNTQQLNYWDSLSQGGIDSPALYKWDKPDGANFYLDGTISTGNKGNFIDTSSNYSPGDPPGKAPDAVSFNMENARVLAFGRLELNVIQPMANTAVISGAAKPGAIVRASFSQNGESYTAPDATADTMGIFHIPLDIMLEEGTIITIRCSWQYLSTAGDYEVKAGAGNLEFFVPASIEFFISEISSHTQTIKRLHHGWEILVSDTRGTGGGWSLYARLESAMAPDRPDLPSLENSLIFVGGSGTGMPMSIGADVLIASHIPAANEDVFAVSWDEDKGILLSVKPGTAFTDTLYTASIIWTLIDAP